MYTALRGESEDLLEDWFGQVEELVHDNHLPEIGKDEREAFLLQAVCATAHGDVEHQTHVFDAN